MVTINNVYQDFQVAIIKEIHKWLPDYFGKDLPVVDQNTTDKMPKYPYITVDIVDDGERDTYSPNTDFMTIRIQLIAVGDNKLMVKNIGRYLREIFTQQQPKHDMHMQGISTPHSIQNVPDTNAFFDSFYQFEAGADMKFIVYSPVIDRTQTGTIEHTKFKEERKNK